MPDIATEFGRRVREQRKLKGWTQTDLSVASGLNRSYLSDVERGKRNITLRQAKVVADTLDIPLRELLDGM